MSKINIAQAAEHFGISKEAIHNRIRRGSLDSVIENGVKYVLLDETQTSSKTTKTSSRSTVSRTKTSADNKYYQLLEEQNIKLQDRVEKLEDETKTLRDQKEQMLIGEREKIEEIYKQKDEQLKYILNSIASKFMLNAPDEIIDEDTHMDAEIEVSENFSSISTVDENSDDKIISLKKYLRKKGFSKKKIEKIQMKFDKHHKYDNRFIVIGKKHYINRSKYKYNDLF